MVVAIKIFLSILMGECIVNLLIIIRVAAQQKLANKIANSGKVLFVPCVPEIVIGVGLIKI